MTKYVQVSAVNGRWSGWIQPIRKGYKMACCDCDLVHDMDLRIVKRGRGHSIQFRVARNNRATAAMRKGRK